VERTARINEEVVYAYGDTAGTQKRGVSKMTVG
jgi:hypothetical protein